MKPDLLKRALWFKGFSLSKARKQMLEDASLPLRLASIVAYHKQHNPFYRELLKDKRTDRFEDLPVLHKSDFQRPLRELLSDGFTLKNCYVNSTSGSTGTPFFFAKDKLAHARSHYRIYELYRQAGVTPTSKQARFYGIPLEIKAKRKERLKDFICNRVRFSVYDYSDDALEEIFRRFARTRFEYIYGYTSSIVCFAQYVLRKGVQLKDRTPSLKCCIVTSEVCTPEDKTLMECAFGIPVVREYGASEVGIIAFDTPECPLQVCNREVYLETVDNRLLVTSLTNKAMPIIRYEIGDTGVLETHGNTQRLRQLTGRVGDIITLPSGKQTAALTFYYVSRSMLEHLGTVKEFVIKQIKADTFLFEAVADREFTAADVAFLQEEVQRYLEPGLLVILHRVSHIERPENGKLKQFYSLV